MKHNYPSCLFLIFVLMMAVCSNAHAVSPRVDFIEQISNTPHDSITLDHLYSRLSPEDKLELAGYIRDLIRNRLPFDLAQRPEQYLDQIQDPEFRAYMSDIVEMLNASTRVRIVRILDEMDRNRLMRTDPAIFRLYHRYIAGSARGSFSDVEATPAFIKEDFEAVHHLHFLNEGDSLQGYDMPETRFNSLMNISGGQVGKLSTLSELPGHTMVNSIQLAKVLNQLSNHRSSDAVYSPVIFNWEGREYTLKNPVDLVNTVFAIDGLEMVAYEARMGVDFAGLHVKTAHGYHPVEMPSLVRARVGNGHIMFPGNHSEYMFAIYRKDEVVPHAIVKWYMGLPADPALQQGSMWNPAITSRAGWAGFKITDCFEDLDSQRRIAHGSTNLMKFFNMIQGQHNFPKNGYAVLAVCNDSIALLRTMIGGDPATSAFPNLRAVNYDHMYQGLLQRYSDKLDISAAGYLNVPSDVYPEIYDHMLRPEYSRRLGYSFPFRHEGDIIGNVYKEVYRQIMGLDRDFQLHIR